MEIKVVFMPSPELTEMLTEDGDALIDSARDLLGSTNGDAEANPEYLKGVVELIATTDRLWEYAAQREHNYDNRMRAVQQALTQKEEWRYPQPWQ